MDRERGLWKRVVVVTMGALLLSAVVARAGGPPAGGTVVAMPELQSFTATVQSEARTGLGPTFATLLGFVGGGLCLISPMLGIGVILIAAYFGFVPSLTGGTFAAVQGADWTTLTAVAGPWSAQWYTSFLSLALPVVNLAPVFADPVVWAAIAVTVMVGHALGTSRGHEEQGYVDAVSAGAQ